MGNKVYKKVLIGVIIATLVIFISTICIVNHKEDQTLKILSKKDSTLNTESGNEVTVTLDYNDGTGKKESATNVSTAPYGAFFNGLPTPTRDGHIFAGWFYGSEKIKDPSYSLRTDSDHTLTAQWKDYADVTLDYNDGTGKTDQIMVFINYRYGLSNGFSESIKRDGYTFKGWYYGDRYVSQYDNLVVLQDHTLIAKWEKNYTVTLDYMYSEDGEHEIQEELSVENTVSPTYPTLPDPTREGYVFCGWWYGGFRAYSNSPLLVEADHYLLAEWKTTEEYYSCTVTLDYGYDNKTTIFSANWSNQKYGDVCRRSITKSGKSRI